VQTFDFAFEGGRVCLTFFLGGQDVLQCRVTCEQMRAPAQTVAQGFTLREARRNAAVAYDAQADAMVLMADPGPWYAVRATVRSIGHQIVDDGRAVGLSEYVIGEAYSPKAGALAGELRLKLEPDASGYAEARIVLGRGTTAEDAIEHANSALRAGVSALCAQQGDDERFWERAPRPTGDWPPSWRRGWVYDLETTRLMARPPAGAFRGVWPTWSLFRPRVVLAENALDMMRLGYADPELAQAALLTVFRDAPRANVPCVFANGGLNMVAEGGEACGTSPAWCLPFHSIYLLYLWHPDRDWLRAVYPYLESYLRWWTNNRRDGDGWFVYRCTWEAGEDGTPRLDPDRTGHGDIFHQVRPVELQAAVAHSALILARLGRELGLTKARLHKWSTLYQIYTERTRSMWDPAQSRFRDAYPPGASPPAERGPYWDGPADISALHVIPMMYGVASPEQISALAARVGQFNTAPWTYWASWTYAVVEAARASGAYEVAGDIACSVLRTVYPRLDRRRNAAQGAQPGTSHEWWPDDASRTTALNETYGWGATTATLMLRHLFGFAPSEETSCVRFELAPALQGELNRPGRRFGFANLHYRGAKLAVELEPTSAERLTARLIVDPPSEIAVVGPDGPVHVVPEGETSILGLTNCRRYEVTVG
jgi:hypothetical protein